MKCKNVANSLKPHLLGLRKLPVGTTESVASIFVFTEFNYNSECRNSRNRSRNSSRKIERAQEKWVGAGGVQQRNPAGSDAVILVVPVGSTTC